MTKALALAQLSEKHPVVKSQLCLCCCCCLPLVSGQQLFYLPWAADPSQKPHPSQEADPSQVVLP